MIFWPIMLVQRVLHLSPLSQDGSGRGAALVAAVLKGKEWRGDPRRLNSSSSPNCLVDHLNQLWPDPQYPRSFHAPPTVSTKSAKYRSQNFKIKLPQSVLCYISAGGQRFMKFRHKIRRVWPPRQAHMILVFPACAFARSAQVQVWKDGRTLTK